MAYSKVRQLPTADELMEEVPIHRDLLTQVTRDTMEVGRIISGQDKRWVVIVGPCSAWPARAVLEWGKKMLPVVQEVGDALKIVVRHYNQKPRTTVGWPGPLLWPDPFGKPNMREGMIYCLRSMRAILELGLPIADEALYTENAEAFARLLSYVALGARSSQDQPHRHFGSRVDCAIGVKNPTSGLIPPGVESVYACQQPQTFPLDGYEVESSGNPLAHLIVRGGSETGPNYHPPFLYEAIQLMKVLGVEHGAIIVDASHDNNPKMDGRRRPEEQVHVVRGILDYVRDPGHLELARHIRGVMIESFVKSGAQSIHGRRREEIDMDGLSATDPCMDWSTTVSLLHELKEAWYASH